MDGESAEFSGRAPATDLGGLRGRIHCCRVARSCPRSGAEERTAMRSIGLDVGRHVAEVAIAEPGQRTARAAESAPHRRAWRPSPQIGQAGASLRVTFLGHPVGARMRAALPPRSDRFVEHLPGRVGSRRTRRSRCSVCRGPRRSATLGGSRRLGPWKRSGPRQTIQEDVGARPGGHSGCAHLLRAADRLATAGPQAVGAHRPARAECVRPR
jgi:hypothetical protein